MTFPYCFMRLIYSILFLLFPIIAQSQLESTSLFFNSNVHTLNSEQKKVLKILSEQSVENNIEILKISAFCDTIGNRTNNDLLAMRRLNSVSNALQFTCSEVTCFSFGERYDIDSMVNYSLEDWRRVDIVYTKKQEIKATPEAPVAIPYTSIFDLLNIHSLKQGEIEPIVLKIQFVPGTDQLLNDTSYYELERLFQFMKNNPKAHAFIRGHVCCGSEPQLAYSRAYAVYTFLVRRAISQKRIEFKGFDNSMPLVWPEKNDSDRQKNRRVDIIFSFPEN